jgi:hypothetical protein
MLRPVEAMRTEDVINLGLGILAEPPPPAENVRLHILLQQMRLGTLGPGKVAVEVHDERLHLSPLPVRPLETDERAGMGEDIAFFSSQPAN